DRAPSPPIVPAPRRRLAVRGRDDPARAAREGPGRRHAHAHVRDRLRVRICQHPAVQRGVSFRLPPRADRRSPRALEADRCRAACVVAIFRREEPTMAKGTLIAAMNIGQAAEDEFQDWYDTEHLPERQRVPGFLVCDRWIGVSDRKISVATYDLETIKVLASPAYLAIGGANLSPWSKRVTSRVERLMRFEGDQILPGDQLAPPDAGGLLLNAMNVTPAYDAEFNEWYDKEHIPALTAVPGVLCARRFRATDDSNRKYVALY